MKNKILSFILFIIAFLSFLAEKAAAGYPIGSANQPVVLGEYESFLEDCAAVQTEPALAENFLGPEMSAITFSGEVNKYAFFLPLAHVMDVIHEVPSEDAQKLFNIWRQNPTVKELCSYLNDKIHIQLRLTPPSRVSPWSHLPYNEEPFLMTNTYPCSTSLADAEKLASSYWAGNSYQFWNEASHLVFSLSRNQLITLETSFATYPSMVNFHRPTFLTADGIPFIQ